MFNKLNRHKHSFKRSDDKESGSASTFSYNDKQKKYSNNTISNIDNIQMSHISSTSNINIGNNSLSQSMNFPKNERQLTVMSDIFDDELEFSIHSTGRFSIEDNDIFE
eukprot:527619_1